MTEKRSRVRKRRPPTLRLIGEESKATLRARLDSEEGQRSLDQFVTHIADGQLGPWRRICFRAS
jgi:hypothetical protein